MSRFSFADRLEDPPVNLKIQPVRYSEPRLLQTFSLPAVGRSGQQRHIALDALTSPLADDRLQFCTFIAEVAQAELRQILTGQYTHAFYRHGAMAVQALSMFADPSFVFELNQQGLDKPPTQRFPCGMYWAKDSIGRLVFDGSLHILGIPTNTTLQLPRAYIKYLQLIYSGNYINQKIFDSLQRQGYSKGEIAFVAHLLDLSRGNPEEIAINYPWMLDDFDLTLLTERMDMAIESYLARLNPAPTSQVLSGSRLDYPPSLADSLPIGVTDIYDPNWLAELLQESDDPTITDVSNRVSVCVTSQPHLLLEGESIHIARGLSLSDPLQQQRAVNLARQSKIGLPHKITNQVRTAFIAHHFRFTQGIGQNGSQLGLSNIGINRANDRALRTRLAYINSMQL